MKNHTKQIVCSARNVRCERVEEVCERVLEVGAVVLQHTTTAATRQIALEESDFVLSFCERASYQRLLSAVIAHVDGAKCDVVCV